MATPTKFTWTNKPLLSGFAYAPTQWPLHARLEIEHTLLFESTGWQVKPTQPLYRLFLTVPGRFEGLPIERYVLQVPKNPRFSKYGELLTAHLEFYRHDGTLALEMSAEVIEQPSKQHDTEFRWFHGVECLCANKETLF